MKSIFKILSVALVSVFIFTACETKPSLQKYIVDSKENEEFISIDIASSILQLKDTEASDDIKNTLKTIKKVNILGLQLSETNKELYDTELPKVKAILKNTKYHQLMRVKMAGANVIVNYLGDNDDAIDEVVILVAHNKEGFGIARILGENMNPSDIVKLAKEIKLDSNSNEIEQLSNILGGL